MSTSLYWEPHAVASESTAFSYFIKKLVQQMWGTPMVLGEAHVVELNAWRVFARSAGADWMDGVAKELDAIIRLINEHGSIELYEY